MIKRLVLGVCPGPYGGPTRRGGRFLASVVTLAVSQFDVRFVVAVRPVGVIKYEACTSKRPLLSQYSSDSAPPCIFM
jgi:hypothetical protein